MFGEGGLATGHGAGVLYAVCSLFLVLLLLSGVAVGSVCGSCVRCAVLPLNSAAQKEHVESSRPPKHKKSPEKLRCAVGGGMQPLVPLLWGPVAFLMLLYARPRYSLL